MDIMGLIAQPFGQLLFLIYNTAGIHNYALSLLIFTIVVKLILLPFSVKQITSSQRMQEIQPEMARIQQMYKNDKEKLNEETMKLYKEKKYNPASGCLPLIIQMPILFALFYVIRMPMVYMLEIPKMAIGNIVVMAVEAKDPDFITASENLLKMKKIKFDDIKGDYLTIYKDVSSVDPYMEIKVIDYLSKQPEALTTVINQSEKTLKNFYDTIADPAKKEAAYQQFEEDQKIYVSRTSRLETSL